MADFTIADTLRQTRAFIAAGWTQHRGAANSAGKIADLLGPEATNFCLWGAYCRARGKSIADMDSELVWAVLRRFTDDDPIGFNDACGRTQAEVLEMLDRVIATLESGEPVTQSDWAAIDAYLADIEQVSA